MEQEETRERLQELLEAYAQHKEDGQEQLVGLLREIQQLMGCIPKELQEQVGTAMDVKLQVIRALIKRIPDLREEAALHELTICTGPRCVGKGSMELLRVLEDKWKLQPGKVTKDGKLRLTTQVCFKKCGESPNIRLDGVLYSHMKPETLLALLETLSGTVANK